MSDSDDDNQSDRLSLSDLTEIGDPPSTYQDDVLDMVEEEQQSLVDLDEEEADPTTPKQRITCMTPTPTPSAAHWHRDIVGGDILPSKPHLSGIPDSMEDGEATLDDWVKIQQSELDEVKAPTPPPKD